MMTEVHDNAFYQVQQRTFFYICRIRMVAAIALQLKIEGATRKKLFNQPVITDF